MKGRTNASYIIDDKTSLYDNRVCPHIFPAGEGAVG